MNTEIIHYQHDGVELKGFLATPDVTTAKTAAILVAHAWKGQDEFARNKAQELASLGYIGFAIDVYGNGTTAESDEEATQLMLPFFLDRKLMRERMLAAYNQLKNHPLVDPNAIGAIGFCFGGLCVIELLRSGADVKGVVSFHGLLGDTLQKHKAVLAPNSDEIKAKLLILHGYKDPLVSSSDIDSVQNEMNKANVDWQMNIYGQALHAFTNPQAHNESGGMVYNRQAAERAWLAMRNFFNALFQEK